MQMSDSIVVVSPDVTELHALYHLFDTRYPTHIVASAEAAMEMTDTHFDLLVVDIPSEKYAWQNVVLSFRKYNRAIKVLALTDGKDRTTLTALRNVGADSAIRKPYAVDDLLRCVRGLLGIKDIDGRLLRSVYRGLAI